MTATLCPHQLRTKLAQAFGDRAPGSRADNALANQVAATLEGLGGPGSGGYNVRARSFSAMRRRMSTEPGGEMLR